MKALDAQDNDLDEVQAEPNEDNEEDDEDEEEDEDDEEGDEDDDDADADADANKNNNDNEGRRHHGHLSNIDDVELSAEAVDQLMNIIHSRKKQKYSLTCAFTFSWLFCR